MGSGVVHLLRAPICPSVRALHLPAYYGQSLWDGAVFERNGECELLPAAGNKWSGECCEEPIRYVKLIELSRGGCGQWSSRDGSTVRTACPGAKRRPPRLWPVSVPAGNDTARTGPASWNWMVRWPSRRHGCGRRRASHLNNWTPPRRVVSRKPALLLRALSFGHGEYRSWRTATRPCARPRWRRSHRSRYGPGSRASTRNDGSTCRQRRVAAVAASVASGAAAWEASAAAWGYPFPI